MTHPNFPSDIPMRGGTSDDYLFFTLRQWYHCCLNTGLEKMRHDLEEELNSNEMLERRLRALADEDDRLRLLSFEYTLLTSPTKGEQMCLEFMSHADVWDREKACEVSVRFGSANIVERLVNIAYTDPDAYVCAACRSLASIDKLRALPVLIWVAEKEWILDPEDQRTPPRDVALGGLDNILGTEFTQRSANGYATFPDQYRPTELLRFAKDCLRQSKE